jgi:hypothetical protein
VDRTAEFVGQHLEFDVARILEVLLQVEHGIAERGRGLGPRHLNGGQ